MKSINFIVEDLVRNKEGLLIAVSNCNGRFPNYHRTVDECEIDEINPDYYFKKKSDIRKIQSSRNKDKIIDAINFNILIRNVHYASYALERIDDSIRDHLQRMGFDGDDPDIYENLPSDYFKLSEIGMIMRMCGRSQSNFVRLADYRGDSAYFLSIIRNKKFWNSDLA